VEAARAEDCSDAAICYRPSSISIRYDQACWSRHAVQPPLEHSEHREGKVEAGVACSQAGDFRADLAGSSADVQEQITSLQRCELRQPERNLAAGLLR